MPGTRTMASHSRLAGSGQADQWRAGGGFGPAPPGLRCAHPVQAAVLQVVDRGFHRRMRRAANLGPGGPFSALRHRPAMPLIQTSLISIWGCGTGLMGPPRKVSKIGEDLRICLISPEFGQNHSKIAISCKFSVH